MARPVRSASLKARKLIAQGYNVEYVDSVGSPGMTPEEEDELNAEISGEGKDEAAAYDVEEKSTGGRATIVGDKNFIFLSYDNLDVEPPAVKFLPSRVPGPHLAERLTRSVINKYTRAIDFFELFLPDEFLETVVENTNLYAWLHILEKPSYGRPRDGAWNPMCLQELKNFLVCIIFDGFAGRSSIDRNWSQATLYSGGWSRRFLSRNRFKALNAMLHVSKPCEEDETDNLAKVRPILDQMKRASSALFQPRQALSIDERMVASKGHSPIRQYMPDKPTRFGYKLWCICDPETGYTFNFDVYTGKTERRSPKGLGYNMVMSLIEPYKNHGHQVFCDNFFTSQHLAQDLLEAGTKMCGTMQPWRRGFPTGKELPKKARRGDLRFVRQDGILYLQWYDSKPVNMLSTIHRGNDHILLVRRGKNKKGEYDPALTRVPKCIRSYNKCMGGVDLADQMIESYNCLVKVTRWWKTLFMHMVDLAVLNSYILFKIWRESHPKVPGLARCSRYAHLDFREEFVHQLANIKDDEGPPIYYPSLKRKKSLDLSGPHDPAFLKFRRNCQVCYILYRKQVKSHFRCADEQCQVNLCLNRSRNCFPTWHSPDFDMHRYRTVKEA